MMQAGEHLFWSACLLVVLCLGVVLPHIHASAEGSMKPNVVEQSEFSIIGIQIRTSNAKEMTSQGDIPKQWSKFYKEGIADKIPNKVDPTIYAVYTNYASDYNGEYDIIIGIKVTGDSDVPPGMVVKTIPNGRFAIITSATGPVEQVVPQAWQRVYSLDQKRQLGGARAYKADFEVYDPRSQNPQGAQVDLYIGLK
jgi:predicted transcriptional regulator YdeE